MTSPRSLALWCCVSMLATACSESAGTTHADAADVVDAVAVDDLAADLGAPDRSDVSAPDRPDVSAPDVPRDAGVDAPAAMDAGVDVPMAVDVGFDAGPADVPGVFFGDLFVPVDPNAVPAPGSECAGDGGVAEGDPSIAPPRPIRPLSVSRVMSQRPSFQWALSDGTTGARVQVCADRCCTRVLQSFDADGTTGRLPVALAPGVVFWRMFGRRGTVVGARASYTWEFGVRHRDTPVDSSWGTIHDFNGDGYDDVIAIEQPDYRVHISSIRLALGGIGGLSSLGDTGLAFGYLPEDGAVGDFNGDGLADFAVVNITSSAVPAETTLEVYEGTRTAVRSVSRVGFDTVGECARAGSPVAVDWNGDGYSDLVFHVFVGCSVSLPVVASLLFVHLGSSSGIATVPQSVLRLDEAFAHREVLVAGGLSDLDLDGYGDVFLSSIHLEAGTSSVPSQHYVAYASGGGAPRYELVSDPALIGLEFLKPHAIGDLDGDGHGEISLSDSPYPPVRVYRPSVGLDHPLAVLSDPIGGGYFGNAITSDDVNGDGLADLTIASPTAATTMMSGQYVNAGRVYIYLGFQGGSFSEPVWVERARAPEEMILSLLFGGPIVSPGDVNGDGFDDIVMGDMYRSRFCVRYGGAAFATATADVCADDGIVSSQVWF